ncbi:hypothetical protein K7X08_034369 [Anisodus acutangulus]|uniref:Uncharacterized protein n=1 Tax=Anisodus acutangulus TaxID=402998 RepID=A0A9Q1R1K2_9SOLA|nr:hypothetical protein K7X08_034369 [Anisodus acutangulus]
MLALPFTLLVTSEKLESKCICIITLWGLASEFSIPKSEDPSLEKNQFHWLYTNGLLGIIFTFGLLYTALKSRKARSWWYGTGWIRSFVADYGVPLMTLLCGLIGLPPSNGVLPQSPMHTKSLAVLKKQLIRKKMVESAKESIRRKASNSEIYGNMQVPLMK